MLYVICFVLGMLVMWLIAGLIVYFKAKPINAFLNEDKKVTLLALLEWPRDVSVMAHAGITDGKDLVPHPNVVAGHAGNQPTGKVKEP